MIRISDIIKVGPQGEPRGDEKGKPVDSLLDKALKREARTDIKQLYNEGIGLMRDIFDKLRQIKDLNSQQAEEYIANSINLKSLADYVSKLVDHILMGNGELFNYFYSYGEENYLYRHSLNVCLLSVKIGTWMNMNKSDLVNIALGAMLHDVGLVTVEDIISLPRKLRQREALKVRKHPAHSANILEMVKDLTEDITGIIKGHHKRVSDRDFTKELSHEKLQRIAQIIGLADVYEAITHPRSYRSGKLPHEGIKELIEKESDNFQAKIIKSLIDNIGIYPIGSWVRLTNGEIGLVVSINKGYPLRPKINILFDTKSEKLAETKSIDLLNEPHLHIESPVDIEKNKQLIDKLK